MRFCDVCDDVIVYISSGVLWCSSGIQITPAGRSSRQELVRLNEAGTSTVDNARVAVARSDNVYCCVVSKADALVAVQFQYDVARGECVVIATQSVELGPVEDVCVISDRIVVSSIDTLQLRDWSLKVLQTLPHPRSQTHSVRAMTLQSTLSASIGSTYICWLGVHSEVLVWRGTSDSAFRVVYTEMPVESSSSKIINAFIDNSSEQLILISSDAYVKWYELDGGAATPVQVLELPHSEGQVYSYIGITLLDDLFFCCSNTEWWCLSRHKSVIAHGSMDSRLSPRLISVISGTTPSMFLFQHMWPAHNSQSLYFMSALDDDVFTLPLSDVYAEIAEGMAVIDDDATSQKSSVDSLPEHYSGDADPAIPPTPVTDAEEDEFKDWRVQLLPKRSPVEGSLVLQPPFIVETRPTGPTSRETALKGASSTQKKSDSHVTFHAKIKSSGYGAPSNVKHISFRKVGTSKPSTAASAAAKSSGNLSGVDLEVGSIVARYNVPGATDVSLPIGPIVQSAIASDGKYAVLAGSDGSLCTAKLQATPTDFKVVNAGTMGHVSLGKSPVKSVAWSHTTRTGFAISARDKPATKSTAAPSSSAKTKAAVEAALPSRFFISCSGDNKQAVVYATGVSEPLFTISDTIDSENAGKQQPFTSSVTNSHFFYHDKFINVCAGHAMYVFAYTVSPFFAEGHTDDVTRLRHKYLRPFAYKRAAFFQCVPEGCSVVAAASQNAERSPCVCVAGSDKAVRIYDLSLSPSHECAATEVLTLSDVHERPIHGLWLPKSVHGWPASPATLNAVLTASTDGCVKLWDLRSAVCAVSLSGAHVNRVHAVGVDFHPNMAQIAVGSEDKTAAIYDLRMAKCVYKCRGATDTVTSVAFHPTSPVLLCGSLDGGFRVHKMDYSQDDAAS